MAVNKRGAHGVVVVNLVVSAVGIALGILIVWSYLEFPDEVFVKRYLDSLAEMIAVSVTIFVLSVFDLALAYVLFRFLTDNSFTLLKIWFLLQSVLLASLTLVFLVDLTSPKLYRVVPLLMFIVYKSVCLWQVGKLVDEIKQELSRNRLAALVPSHPGNEQYINSIDPYYNSLPG